jgi:4-hydroxy-tetrahydrodipicolinate reductase
MDRTSRLIVQATKPALMVNSCTGKMGRAVAEAAVKAGLPLVPYTLCGAAEAAASSSVEVSGQLLKLVGPDTRDQLIEQASTAITAFF